MCPSPLECPPCACPVPPDRYTTKGRQAAAARTHADLLNFINYVINLYSYVVFAAVIMSFLLAFNVINPRNAVVQTIWTTLTALTEPLHGPIRPALPDFGAIDLSPVVLLLGLYFNPERRPHELGPRLRLSYTGRCVALCGARNGRR